MCVLDRIDASTNPVDSLPDILERGQEVHARVRELDFSGQRLQLVCKRKELQQSAAWEELYLRDNDPFYHVQSDKEAIDIATAKNVRPTPVLTQYLSTSANP